MRIVYHKPEDAILFDMDRYHQSLNKYGQVSKEDIKQGIETLRNQFSDTIHVSCLVRLGAQLIPDEDKARKYYEEHNNSSQPFERIARITGYLVGSVNRWNDGKRAELKERVKHNIKDEGSRKIALISQQIEAQNEYHR